jgi:enamine deaminase RidA (YjgF/YER057c/UK114 family)
MGKANTMKALRMTALGLGAALALASAAQAQNVHINPANGAIAKAVKVPAGSETLYVSGITPQPMTPAAGATPAVYGDTKAQTASVLAQIGDILKGEGYGFEDVVMMRVLLVGDATKGGKMDFAGMMESYTAVFGPLKNKPARITSQVAALVQPPLLVEIEVQAAKKPR